MTATRKPAVRQVGAHGDAMMCDVCGHALAAHDRIAQRYCESDLA
jgi:hypothetical protein